MTSTTPDIEALAAELGEQIYIDVAKWHLFLAEAHLHVPLAERVYPLLESDTLHRSGVEAILQQLPVSIGGGKVEISLLDAIPAIIIDRLMMVLEDYQRQNF
ncbi:MAG: DUF3181 family protein [Synechocystis sp.]|nr:DUF3181 family protein [Synechocystis sp.]